VQWTVDDLDSGGGLMTNKNKSLASESNGDVILCTIPSLSLGHSWGGSGESFIGSKTKLFEKVFSKEFWNIKLFLKIPGFQFFSNPSFPPESVLRNGNGRMIFLKMAGCLRTHRFLSLFLVFDTRRIPPRRAGACNTLKEPAGGLWGILNEINKHGAET